jgi:hypothetical protein
MDSTPDQANVPIGQRDLERYNEPAYMRRGTGINRGGYDIRKREEAAPKAEEKPAEQSKQAEAQEQPKRQAAADKPAFLRRIMD